MDDQQTGFELLLAKHHASVEDLKVSGTFAKWEIKAMERRDYGCLDPFDTTLKIHDLLGIDPNEINESFFAHEKRRLASMGQLRKWLRGRWERRV